MAHTEPRRGDKRKQVRPFKVGQTVYMMYEGQEISGPVTDYDNGGWIYVGWETNLPVSTWLRATQVYTK